MTVELKIDGLIHSGWKSARITRGIERVASDFSLTVTEKTGTSSTVPDIRPGRLCELLDSGEKIVTGYVDEVSTGYDAGRRTVTFRGRSKTSDLVDCSAINKPGEWSDVGLAKIAADIAAVYGVSVISGDVGEAFSTFRLQPAETAFNAIERACRMRAVLATDDAEGRLVLARAGADRASTEIRCTPADRARNNVLSADALFSHRDRYSKYTVKGQAAGTDDIFGEAAAQPVASATDAGITRRREIILQSETQGGAGTMRERVEWEKAVREGKSLTATYTLQGWREASGTLWRPNSIVSVVDDMGGVRGDLLISEVTYSIDDRGSLAILSVLPPEAFTRLREAEDSGGGSVDPLAKYLGGA